MHIIHHLWLITIWDITNFQSFFCLTDKRREQDFYFDSTWLQKHRTSYSLSSLVYCLCLPVLSNNRTANAKILHKYAIILRKYTCISFKQVFIYLVDISKNLTNFGKSSWRAYCGLRTSHFAIIFYYCYLVQHKCSKNNIKF